MKRFIAFLTLVASCLHLSAASANETNATERNTTSTHKTLMQKEIEKQMAREKKYAKEQKFYMGKEYDLKSREVDPKMLKDIAPIVPDYAHTNEWGAADNE